MANGEGLANKHPDAFRTIREVADELGVPQHMLRFWETRFEALKPLQRGGNRRYYRPADVALATAIHKLLHRDKYTVKGVQQLLAEHGPKGLIALAAPADAPAAQPVPVRPVRSARAPGPRPGDAAIRAELKRLRDGLAAALADAPA